MGLDLLENGDGLQPSLRDHVRIPACVASSCCVLVRCSRRPPVVTALVYGGCPAGTHWGDDSSRVMSHPRANSVLAVRRRVTRVRQLETVEL